MNTLSMDQMRRLTAHLQELSRLSQEREAASEAHAAANRRWNEVRTQYAQLHAQVVAEFGEENAPLWIDAYHGQRSSAPIKEPQP